MSKELEDKLENMYEWSIDTWKEGAVAYKNLTEDYKLLKQALEELEELKATVKELLDIPITVSTFSGTSRLIKIMNKLERLVGDKDE